MRKIERQMNDAIATLPNGGCWKMDNTEVFHVDGIVEVFLHGNTIAELGDFFIRLFDGGFRSATTKSRINAILRENGTGNESVFQKSYQWFISYDGKTEPFVSGVTLK